jgi:hypothetical protein
VAESWSQSDRLTAADQLAAALALLALQLTEAAEKLSAGRLERAELEWLTDTMSCVQWELRHLDPNRP